MTNQKGRFGTHGGQYIPETLMNAVIELEAAYEYYKNDPEFNRELTELFNEYAGRPSRLYYAEKMTKALGGAKIYLKREDLNHTGAHKINNVLGQALLAKKMGKTRLIAETGAGQHGVATATAAALMGMECVVFMGEEDTIRQALNVYRMRLLGAEVIPVTTGTATLKDAVSEAMREWTSRIADTHYCLGSVMGPHPFPTIVRDFQAVISKEIKEQILQKEGRLPDAVIACVGGGSNAICSFYVALFRGTPMVVQLLVFYYVLLPIIGLKITGVQVAMMVFGLNSGAYISEIMRSGIQSVDPGQMEAGRAVGLSFGTSMIKIVIPQAVKNILPTLGNEFISLIKETSVVSFVGAADLYVAFNYIGSNSYEFMVPYLVMALIYIVLVLIISLLIKLMERSLKKSDRRN